MSTTVAFKESNSSNGSGLTLAILGCGTMGIAILSGILSSLASEDSHPSASSDSSAQKVPKRLPNRFLACVRSSASAKRITDALPPSRYPNLTVLQNENLKAAEQADIVILGCKPFMVRDLLGDRRLHDSLKGKLFISICAGVTYQQLKQALRNSTNVQTDCMSAHQLVRAMPNTASFVRESMTVIATPEFDMKPETRLLLEWIFTRIGRVTFLPEDKMDASTALCASGPAFCALVIEAMADGAVAMGLPRAEAQAMAAQTMRGTTGLVLGGEHPSILREKVSTPGGCTIGGLLVLEEGAVRGTVAKAVREAAVVASELGSGKKNVNGTWRN